jgi:hypothetical protein
MKFKLILRIFRLVFTLLVRLSVVGLNKGLFPGTPGYLAEICIGGYNDGLFSEYKNRLGVGLHLSQEVY